MKIYFDESRNTGEIGYNNDKLNYYSQRYFVLVGVIENKSLFNFYKGFIEKHDKIAKVNNNGNKEIKGEELCSKKNSAILQEFITNVIKCDDIYVNIYDKKYFLVSQLIIWLCGIEFKEKYYSIYLNYCELLHKLNDELLIEYIKVTKDNSKDNVEKFIKFILSYKYSECIGSYFELKLVQEWVEMINIFYENKEYIDTLVDSNFENVTIAGRSRNNIVNLTALGELILLLKLNQKKSNKDIQIVHDEIEVIQEYIKYYWNFDNIKFTNSEREIGIQIADNLASLIGKVINNIFPILNDNTIKTILTDEYKWVRYYSNYIFNNINNENIKFVSTIRESSILYVYNNLDVSNIFEFKLKLQEKLDERMISELKNYVSHNTCMEILNK